MLRAFRTVVGLFGERCCFVYLFLCAFSPLCRVCSSTLARASAATSYYPHPSLLVSISVVIPMCGACNSTLARVPASTSYYPHPTLLVSLSLVIPLCGVCNSTLASVPASTSYYPFPSLLVSLSLVISVCGVCNSTHCQGVRLYIILTSSITLGLFITRYPPVWSV